MNIMVVTSCGNKKNKTPMEAYKLYKSSRIKAIYNRKGNNDMYILSAKYGLINANDIIKPYNLIMDEKISKRLEIQIIPIMSNYDLILFYAGGSNKNYRNCIENAAKRVNKKIIIMGYGFMGDFNKFIELVNKFSTV